MSDQQHDKPEAAPNSDPAPSASTKLSLDRTIDLPPSGRCFVIGGLPPPAAAKASKQGPELHVLNPRTAKLAQIIDLSCKRTGCEPTPEEIDEARAEWESDDGTSED